MSNLCWVCQRNNTHILRAVNVPEEMKSATLPRQEEHLRLATLQRTEYQAMCAARARQATQHHRARKEQQPTQHISLFIRLCSTTSLPRKSPTAWPHLLQDPSEDAVLRRASRRNFTPNDLPHRRGFELREGSERDDLQGAPLPGQLWGHIIAQDATGEHWQSRAAEGPKQHVRDHNVNSCGCHRSTDSCQ